MDLYQTIFLLLLTYIITAATVAFGASDDPTSGAALKKGEECVDSDVNCKHWTNYCQNNNWVRKTCVQSCTSCDPIQRDLDPSNNPNRQSTHKPVTQKRVCGDEDGQCEKWIKGDSSLCFNNKFIIKSCKGTCNLCGGIPQKYDAAYLPYELRPVGFLLGRWRSEFGGKATFPTIPKFTYGEQLDFSIADAAPGGAKFLNYTAFAWGINNQEELHSEYGFLAVKNFTNDVALTTVQNNGFTTVEEGRVACHNFPQGHFDSCPRNPEIQFRLQDIGRVSFSRDLPVHDLIRTWRLVGDDQLEARLEMETLTHRLQEHTAIVFRKVYP